MSRYDNEQEQLDAIKAWWAKYGTMVLSALLVVVLSFSGWRYWQAHQYSKSANASAIFEVLSMSQDAGAFGEVSREARQLMQEQPRSPYSGASALMLAQFNWERGETEQSIADLQWVLDNPQSAEIKHVAGLRLARLHIQLQDYTQAQAVIDQLSAQAQVNAERANIDYIVGLLAQAQNQPEQAYQAFKRVVDNEQGAADLRNLSQLFMDDLVQP